MSRADMPMYPGAWTNDGDRNASAPDGAVVPPFGMHMLGGLTIREHFAAMAMQGYCANAGEKPLQLNCKQISELSVVQADALLAELARPVRP